MEVTIGGERLGSGNKMKAYGRNYERSTHNLDQVWRSTMAPGTLVPCLNLIGLPGDTFDIDMGAVVMTHPTIGPLFGSYKFQLDVFKIPMRLFIGKLHMNMIGIGMDMKNIKFPLLDMNYQEPIDGIALDNQQINPSCILSYLGIRGVGTSDNPTPNKILGRSFNALPFLSYWSIYKQYYANKSEGIGVVIHKDVTIARPTIISARLIDVRDGSTIQNIPINSGTGTDLKFDWNTGLEIKVDVANNKWNWWGTKLWVKFFSGDNVEVLPNYYWTNINIDGTNDTVTFSGVHSSIIPRVNSIHFIKQYTGESDEFNMEEAPYLETFDLKNIDDMRMDILADVKNPNAFIINRNSQAPYGLIMKHNVLTSSADRKKFSKQWGQEGLGIKTYQSDLLNNWLDTEWIDGVDGISELTKIDTSSGGFTIDELNFQKKVYNLFNRVALSGGDFKSWIETVYTHEFNNGEEEPVYLGGLIKEVVFQEVISQSATEAEPLGTLAGRGAMSPKHKGGQVVVKCNEPCLVMGIASLTPRIDYSQGNDWSVNLKTMDELHKPELSGIGYQELITEQFAWWDTKIGDDFSIKYKSAGKQPAWINYMTAINKTYGNFADQYQQMFMTLNRRYESMKVDSKWTIRDLTTYIDPSKYNNIFADTRIDAQNFWVQIGFDIVARRKMSAKVIPNL